jgi:hypothetical protein
MSCLHIWTGPFAGIPPLPRHRYGNGARLCEGGRPFFPPSAFRPQPFPLNVTEQGAVAPQQSNTNMLKWECKQQFILYFRAGAICQPIPGFSDGRLARAGRQPQPKRAIAAEGSQVMMGRGMFGRGIKPKGFLPISCQILAKVCRIEANHANEG